MVSLGESLQLRPVRFKLAHCDSRFWNGILLSTNATEVTSYIRKSNLWRRFKGQTWIHIHTIGNQLTLLRELLEVSINRGRPSHPYREVNSWWHYFAVYHDLFTATASVARDSPFFDEYERAFFPKESSFALKVAIKRQPIDEKGEMGFYSTDEYRCELIASKGAIRILIQLWEGYRMALIKKTNKIKRMVEPSAVRSFYIYN